jgi:tryptophanyl-tRNA synthetase
MLVRRFSSQRLRCIHGATGRCIVDTAQQTPPIAGEAVQDEGDDVITPWSVKARGPKGIDYARVETIFKSQPVTDDTMDLFRQAYAAAHARRSSSSIEDGGAAPPSSSSTPSLPPVVHHFIRRRIVFTHRDADAVLQDVVNGKKAYLYTGRGPSADAMHIGHVVPFLLTRHLQQALDLPLVVQLTDDEKFLFRAIPLDKMDKMARNNIKDIIAFGFDPAKTFIFRNTHYMGDLYPTALELQRLFTLNAVRNTFGFKDDDCVGKYSFAATQAAPCFASAFPRVLPWKSRNVRCLVPCAVDQDPFFVLTRTVADRLKRPKPSLLLTKFLPALKGATHKMSSSAEEHGTILVTDDEATIRRKIKRAFSGGKGTLADLQAGGADLDVDVAYQLLTFFCDSDDKLADIGRDYSSGKISTGAVKDVAADCHMGAPS